MSLTPKAPYQDSLRMDVFHSVRKWVPIDKKAVVTGDVISLYDQRGRVMQYNGAKILLVVDASTVADVTEYKLVPQTDFAVFFFNGAPTVYSWFGGQRFFAKV